MVIILFVYFCPVSLSRRIKLLEVSGEEDISQELRTWINIVWGEIIRKEVTTYSFQLRLGSVVNEKETIYRVMQSHLEDLYPEMTIPWVDARLIADRQLVRVMRIFTAASDVITSELC